MRLPGYPPHQRAARSALSRGISFARPSAPLSVSRKIDSDDVACPIGDGVVPCQACRFTFGAEREAGEIAPCRIPTNFADSSATKLNKQTS